MKVPVRQKGSKKKNKKQKQKQRTAECRKAKEEMNRIEGSKVKLLRLKGRRRACFIRSEFITGER